MYTKNTDKKPSTKFLPFGVIRLQHTLTGGALLGRTKPPESRIDETGSIYYKSSGQKCFFPVFWGLPQQFKGRSEKEL